MDYKKEFLQRISDMANMYSEQQVFFDFVQATACHFSVRAVFDKDLIILNHERLDNREEIFKRHGSKGKERFNQLLIWLYGAYEENQAQDFLGSAYMQLNEGRGSKGQFFTAYHISELTAALAVKDAKEVVLKQGFISISEPSVGAGAMVIAAANELIRQGIDCRTQAWFDCQDIDMMAGLCGYIQMSMIGLAGRVIIADSLKHPRLGELKLDELYQQTYFTPNAGLFLQKHGMC